MRRRDGFIFSACVVSIIFLISLQLMADGESAIYGQKLYRSSFFASLDAYCFHDDVEGHEGEKLGMFYLQIMPRLSLCYRSVCV